jgi:CheY-specific phosphatase CheX
MPDSLEAQALSGAVRDVLETMFFTDVVSDKTGHAGASGPALDAQLRFQGGRSGEFRIAIVPGAARTIAGNFLGAEEESEIQEDQVGEVVCELANMICGSVLSRLAGDLAFELSHPELVPGDGDGAGWPETAARTFELEHGWLTAAIRFEEP